jgi:WD repeat-containing protein 55
MGWWLTDYSGDGTLSVLDVRSKQSTPFAQSEDQEDELLSILAIKGCVPLIFSSNRYTGLNACRAQKIVVGTQLGILTVFNRRSGYADCVDRVPGHPHSIDALAHVPSRYANAESTILTGSSDGLVRVVELFPSKLLGVVADHGEFPVERVKVDKDGEGNWVASVGHEELIKLTDLRELFEDDGPNEENDTADVDEDRTVSKESQITLEEISDDETEDGSDQTSDIISSLSGCASNDISTTAIKLSEVPSDGQLNQNSDSDSDVVIEARKRKKREKDPFRALKRSKGRNELEADSSFFTDL